MTPSKHAFETILVASFCNLNRLLNFTFEHRPTTLFPKIREDRLKRNKLFGEFGQKTI